MKKLVITIEFPIPEAGGKIAEAIIIEGAKAMFPKDKLPIGATVDFTVKQRRK
ncbi:unnamed protein product [marine sediment metagenome]|uniref:Uncharacterized protein n=1 Tax=marine sediment metagenome TaxID=412755 RepID=X1UHJ6_9ZZZZ